MHQGSGGGRDRRAEAERRLDAWGRACRRDPVRLGLPPVSNVATTIAHVRRRELDERELDKQHRRALRTTRNAWRPGDAPIDPRKVAEERGFAARPVTARAKQRLQWPPAPSINDDVAEIDKVIAGLPRWAQRVVDHTFHRGEPDRVAALNIEMRRGEYAQRRLAAVDLVAAALAQGSIGKA